MHAYRWKPLSSPINVTKLINMKLPHFNVIPPKKRILACFHPFILEKVVHAELFADERRFNQLRAAVAAPQSTCPKLTKIRFFFFSYTEHTYLFYASHICRKIERKLPQLKNSQHFVCYMNTGHYVGQKTVLAYLACFFIQSFHFKIKNVF